MNTDHYHKIVHGTISRTTEYWEFRMASNLSPPQSVFLEIPRHLEGFNRNYGFVTTIMIGVRSQNYCVWQMVPRGGGGRSVYDFDQITRGA